MDELFPVAPGVSRLTVNLDDDDVTLFEGLWPVPHGVALHAYLIEGERRALVDIWNAGGYGTEEIEADLASRGLSLKDIDVVVGTREVPAGAKHDLGGVTLEERGGFWFVEPAGVALTGDAFAGLGWIEDEPWAEDLSADAARHFDDEALRWFCGRPLAPEALPENTKIVAPAHGCLWGRNPLGALERARKFASWARGDALGEIAVFWPAGAAFDAGFDALVGAALAQGAGLNLFRLPEADTMGLAAAARRSSLLVIARGSDERFLAGIEKDAWRPDPATDAATLRAELAGHWTVP